VDYGLYFFPIFFVLSVSSRKHIFGNSLCKLIHAREVHGGDIYALQFVVNFLCALERVRRLGDKLAVGLFCEVQPRQTAASASDAGSVQGITFLSFIL